MTTAARSALLLLCLAASPMAAVAQEPMVLPRLTGAIQLDGLSDEPAWQAVEPLPMVMQTPNFGESPSERTEFRVAYDDQYLYAAGRLYDSDPRGIRAASLKRDDGSFANDWFVINLDAFNDKEALLVFGINPAGVRTDAVFGNDGQGSPNFTWNTFWDAAVKQTDEGWFAELRIPLSSLRFQERDGRVVMGMSAWRRIARKNEMIVFPAIPPKWGLTSVFKASQAREVVLEGVHRSNPVYATPFLLAGAERTHALTADRTAWSRGGETVREVGVDLKYGVTSNLTLDLTYNTDFAQVEADDQQVNLSRFSLFFPEKRLFFQERAGVFDVPLGASDRLFYSRRIGLANGVPVPVYGGARLVGRVGKWDVGMLDMQTEAVGALATENFGVLRLRRQVLNPNSYLGGIVTTRSGGGRADLVYGLDGLLRLFRQDFVILNWAQSFLDDEPAATGFLDRSLVRARWERRGVDGLTYAVDATRSGAAFDPTVGFLRRRDFTRFGDHVSYGWRPGKSSRVLRHSLRFNASAYLRNEDGATESLELGPQWETDTKRGHRFSAAALSTYEDLDREFRLASTVRVPAGIYRFHSFAAGYSAPDAWRVRSSFNVEGGSFYDGRRVSVGATPRWNPSSHLELSASYQGTRADFAERDQRLTAHVARLRAGAMLNTRLSLASFVQYSSAVDGLFANVRVRYNPREGNDFYLVYNTGMNTDRHGFAPVRPLLDNQTLLLKYSRTVNLGF